MRDSLEQACVRAATTLLARHEWSLLERDELVRQSIVFIREGIADTPERAVIHTYSQALHRACSGEEGIERQNRGYSELYYYLYAIALRRYSDVYEDATQAAIEQIYTVFALCRQPGTFLAFALHRLMNAVRVTRRQAGPESHRNSYEHVQRATFQHQHDPLEMALQGELRARFAMLAADFRQRHRRAARQFAALQLKYLEGLDDEAIAERLGVPLRNVYVLRSRAIKKLRAEPAWRAFAAELGIGLDET